MAKFIIGALAALVLAGCASTLEGAYDEAARTECERETRPQERGACVDRVDENRRARE